MIPVLSRSHARYRAFAAGGGGGDEPVAGYSLWLKADAGTLDPSGNPATNGVAVQTWQDQSGNGYDGTPPASAFRPSLKTGVLNGLPVIECAVGGNAQGFTINHNFAAPFTAFIVGRENGSTHGEPMAGVSNRWLLGWWNGSEDQAYFNGVVHLTGSPSSTTNFHLYTGKSNGATGYLYSNGTLVGSGGGVDGPNVIHLGLGGNAGATSDCQIAEVLIYPSALSDADREAVELYLQEKYAL